MRTHIRKHSNTLRFDITIIFKDYLKKIIKEYFQYSVLNCFPFHVSFLLEMNERTFMLEVGTTNA